MTPPTFYLTYRLVPVLLGLTLAALIMWHGWRAMVREDPDPTGVALGWLVLGGTGALALWGLWLGITSPIRFY